MRNDMKVVSIKKIITLLLAILLIFSCSLTAYAGETESSFDGESEWHWQKTNAIYLGPNKNEAQAGPIKITAQHGHNGKDMVFTFDVTGKMNASGRPLHNCKGEQVWYNVNYYRGMEDHFYAGDKCEVQLNFNCNFDERHSPGDVKCSMYFADITPGDDDFSQSVEVKDYFTKGGTKPDTSVKIKDIKRKDDSMEGDSGDLSKYGTMEYYFRPAGIFPEGKREGEKLYVVLDCEDDFDAGVKFRTYWEYTWVYAPVEDYYAWKLDDARKKPNPFYEDDRP